MDLALVRPDESKTSEKFLKDESWCLRFSIQSQSLVDHLMQSTHNVSISRKNFH